MQAMPVQAMPAHGMMHMSVDAVFERMRRYEAALERTSPPVFVGRKGELDALQAAVDLVASDNPRGMTRIVQGVPGAGKSSLCDEFMASVQGRILHGRRVLCAKLDPSNLGQPPLDLVNKLTDALPHSLAQVPGTRRFVSDRHALFPELASAALQVMRRPSVRQMPAAVHGLTAESDLGACVSAHARRLWPKDALLVLAFDEMQECPARPRAAAALRILNECLHDARILVACFGLQNTETVLRERLGLSRIPADAIADIGPLAPGEGREVLEKTLDHFGASAGNGDWRRHLQATGLDPDAWTAWRKNLLDDLEERAGNFPQHLTAALRATCQVLCRNRDGCAPPNEWTAEIVARHERNKADYYAKRLGDGLRLHRVALGAVVRAADEKSGLPMRDAFAAFMASDDAGRAVDGDKAEALVRLAIARGVLGEAEVDGVLCCVPPPVPSMTRHLAEHCDRMLARRDPCALALADRLGLALPAPDSAPRQGVGAWQSAKS